MSTDLEYLVSQYNKHQSVHALPDTCCQITIEQLLQEQRNDCAELCEEMAKVAVGEHLRDELATALAQTMLRMAARKVRRGTYSAEKEEG